VGDLMTPIVLKFPFKTADGQQAVLEIHVAGRVLFVLPEITYAELSHEEARELAQQLSAALGETDPGSN
jgi:hypothetical protein